MSRSVVQPWVPPLVLSLPTCSWKSLKSKPLALPLTPHIWLQFVDDSLVIHKAEQSKHLLQHINSQDPNMQFTVEEQVAVGSIHFLETNVTLGPNSTIHTTVYRKLTHTDQYIHWDSNPFITAKHSVYNTLAHRAKVVSNSTTNLSKELEHIRRALQSCLFPTWAINRLQQNFKHKHINNRDPNPVDSQHSNHHNSNDTTNHNKHRNISMVVLYI